MFCVCLMLKPVLILLSFNQHYTSSRTFHKLHGYTPKHTTFSETEGIDEFMAQAENTEALAILFVFPVRSLVEFLLSVPKWFVLFLSA